MCSLYNYSVHSSIVSFHLYLLHIDLDLIVTLSCVLQGRGGLGTIYVWASGNGGSMMDNCNLDGYTSSIYTLSVSAITDLGISTFYSEPCASTLAGVYVGGQHTLKKDLERSSSQMQMKVVSVGCVLLGYVMLSCVLFCYVTTTSQSSI